MTPLPAPRARGSYRVELVCLGNICRSPMAAVVLRDRVAAAGLGERVEVVSSGTGGWHAGHPMDPRAAAALRAAGYDATDVAAHRARRYDGGSADGADGADRADLLLAMDADNLATITEQAAPADTTEPERRHLFRDHDDRDPGADVPDPYYGGEDGFEEVLAMVERTADHLVVALADRLADRSRGDR